MNGERSWKLFVAILFLVSGLHFKRLFRTTKNLHEFNRDSYAEVQGSQLESVCI